MTYCLMVFETLTRFSITIIARLNLNATVGESIVVFLPRAQGL